MTQDPRDVSGTWEPNAASPSCRVCNAYFSLVRWRHHCRGCGRLVCNGCSKARATRCEISQNSYFPAVRAGDRLCTECVVPNRAQRQHRQQAHQLTISCGASEPIRDFGYKPEKLFYTFLMLSRMPRELGRLVGSATFQGPLRLIFQSLLALQPYCPVFLEEYQRIKAWRRRRWQDVPDKQVCERKLQTPRHPEKSPPGFRYQGGHGPQPQGAGSALGRSC